MSKFFVGQRVRLVRSVSGIVPIGSEGIVYSIGVVDCGGGDFGDCLVKYPGYPSGFVVDDCWAADFDQLEPILPEGSAPSEFTFQQLMDNLREVMA